MANAKTKLVWNTVSVAKVPALNALYADVTKAQETLKKAKAAFEPKFKAMLKDKGLGVIDDTHDIVVGYNFGQLSFAQADKSEAKKAAAIEL